MITRRPAAERGRFDHGWLDTRHTFSFGSYVDPRHMGFRVLRVINEDFVKPGQGFGTHPHRDMEIVTYVVAGELEHRDSLGSGSVIRPGEVQRMSAGSGVTHSEFNPSEEQALHLLQIWVLPAAQGAEPAYEQRHFPESERRDRLRLVVSPDGRDGSLSWGQDARLYAALTGAGGDLELELAPGRHAWVQVVRGEIAANGVTLQAGDGAAVSDEPRLALHTLAEAEILVFDLP